MDCEIGLQLEVAQDGPPTCISKRDELKKQLEILTSSMEGDVRIAVTPTENTDSEITADCSTNEYWIGIDPTLDPSTVEALFSIDEETSENEIGILEPSRGSEEYLTSVDGTGQATAKVQENVVENKSLVHDVDKISEGHVEDVATQIQGGDTDGIESKEIVDNSAIYFTSVSSKSFENIPELDAAESDTADQPAVDVKLNQNVDSLAGMDSPESEKPKNEAAEISRDLFTDDKLKKMEEGSLPRGNAPVPSRYHSCESLQVEESRVETLSPSLAGNDYLWREMAHALEMVDVTLQRACLQTAFNVVTAFLHENFPAKMKEGAAEMSPDPKMASTLPSGQMSPRPNTPIQSKPQVLPSWSVQTQTSTPADAQRHQQQQRLRPASPVVSQVPNYFRGTESSRRKLTNPPLTSTFRKSGNLPPLRPTPKKENKSKPRNVSDRCDLVVEAKSMPRSIRGGGKVIPRLEVKSVVDSSDSSPVIASGGNLSPRQNSRSRRMIYGGYPMAMRHSKRRDSKPPRPNPY